MRRLTNDDILRVKEFLLGVKNPDSAPEGKWNTREIVGHLVDSGINNLYRYQRILINGEVTVRGYEQDKLVAFQNYASMRFPGLIDVWVAINTLVLNFIENIPNEQLGTRVDVEGTSLTLEEMLLDYIEHIDHHLKQIEALQ